MWDSKNYLAKIQTDTSFLFESEIRNLLDVVNPNRNPFLMPRKESSFGPDSPTSKNISRNKSRLNEISYNISNNGASKKKLPPIGGTSTDTLRNRISIAEKVIYEETPNIVNNATPLDLDGPRRKTNVRSNKAKESLALLIQALYRGFKIRLSKGQPEEENAAKILQSAYRGRVSKKQAAKAKQEAIELQSANRDQSSKKSTISGQPDKTREQSVITIQMAFRVLVAKQRVKDAKNLNTSMKSLKNLMASVEVSYLLQPI
jgi:hypothetical protein